MSACDELQIFIREFEREPGVTVANKSGDAAIFRKYKAFGIPLRKLEGTTKVVVFDNVRKVVLSALSSDILSYGLTNKDTQRSSHLGTARELVLEYFYPLNKWKFEYGNPNWLAEINLSLGWKLINKGEKQCKHAST